MLSYGAAVQPPRGELNPRPPGLRRALSREPLPIRPAAGCEAAAVVAYDPEPLYPLSYRGT